MLRQKTRNEFSCTYLSLDLNTECVSEPDHLMWALLLKAVPDFFRVGNTLAGCCSQIDLWLHLSDYFPVPNGGCLIARPIWNCFQSESTLVAADCITVCFPANTGAQRVQLIRILFSKPDPSPTSAQDPWDASTLGDGDCISVYFPVNTNLPNQWSK